MPNPDGSARCEVVDANYFDVEGKMVRRVRILPDEPAYPLHPDIDGDTRPLKERRFTDYDRR